MPLHTAPPSGNRRHLTSANAGAFIHQSVAAAWMPVPDHDGLYDVSDDGRVRNARTGRVLKPFVTDRGYLIVRLHKAGSAKNFKIHRLVLAAFVRLPEPDDEGNHKDFDKANNRLSNLEWLSGAENTSHYLESGCNKYGVVGGWKGMGQKLSDQQVKEVQFACDTKAASRRELAKRYGISSTTVCCIANRVGAYAAAPIADEVVPPASSAPIHIAKERTRAIFPAHCSSLASRAASGLIKNLNLFLAGQLRRKARTATNSDGRPATRSFDCRHTPSPAAWRAVSYANPSQAHAAPAIHGATL